ncbi:MAG TPA: DUF3300 domain-containing protein [Candidatus Acidoferrum sp.]|nr:DUF3300 domain-containing protein [Candidatus Acidoferrum sp.]
MNFLKRSLAVWMSALLLWATLPVDGEGFFGPEPGRAGQEVYAPVPEKDMDALVAPIALYPDALVAQILGAATYPDQVEAADVFVKANSSLSGDALIQAAEDQEWDPSVMALLRFPSVLEKLAQNLGWTSALGDVSANQQADVMAAIQRMRAKADAAGTLKSGEQIKVVKESPDIIVIQPANPQVVYVPAYNPTVVYGTTVVTPGYSAGDVAAVAVISFGVGIAVGAMVSSSSCGWGYYGWKMNWTGHMVYCGGGPYYGNPYWWGGYYPGFRPGYRPPYYPPPRPPLPPPSGWRPPPPGARPPYRPPGGKPPGVYPPPGGRPPGSVKPTPLPAPGRPGGPSTQPVRPGGSTTLPAQPSVQPRPTTRPGTPGGPAAPSTRELRGYPTTTPNAKPASKPNAFSGTTGGRPESARGNRSLSPPPKAPSAAPRPTSTPARAPSGGARKR